MSLQLEYENASSGLWAHWDYLLCPCRNGWYLSDVDTWHKCRFHCDDSLNLHPEDDHAILSEKDFEKYRTEQLRNTYRRYADLAGLTPKEMTRRVLKICDKTDTPERMIQVARNICDAERDVFWSVENQL